MEIIFSYRGNKNVLSECKLSRIRDAKWGLTQCVAPFLTYCFFSFPAYANDNDNSTRTADVYGRCEITRDDGAKYAGSCLNGKAYGEGHCEITRVDVAKYAGSCINGVAQGRGTTIFPNSDELSAEYKNDQANGYGKMLLSSSSIPSSRKNEYIGNFKDGKFEGEGEFIWHDLNPNYVSYKGNFKNGLMDGYGYLTYSFGDQYRGSFKNGKEHGDGYVVKYNNAKASFSGIWEDGKLVKKHLTDDEIKEAKAAAEREEKYKAASIAQAKRDKEQRDFSNRISKNKSQNPRDYSNLVACIFPYDSSTAMDLASNLARIAASSSPIIFSSAMTSGGFAKYCQIAYGAPSKENITNATAIAKGQNSIYWCVNRGNAALCFTSPIR